jgi:hypothetical protein
VGTHLSTCGLSSVGVAFITQHSFTQNPFVIFIYFLYIKLIF